jgi:thiamine biosynthesis lipoprotein
VTEHVRDVPCFGGQVTVRASGTGATGFAAPAALVLAEALLVRVHARLTCFDAGSELSRLNDDERHEVPASPLVRRFAAAVAPAGWLSGGLVDATVGSPGGAGSWHLVGVGLTSRSVRRPPGVRLDSGGLAKGLAADLVAERLAGHPSYAVECLGDLRVGGTEARPRRVRVADPFGGEAPVALLHVTDGAVATSGTTRRAGHLIDPRTGEPADTGIVQVTAPAPTGLEAEVRAKAALLAGPGGAAGHLPYGGVIVTPSGTVVELPPQAAPQRVSG